MAAGIATLTELQKPGTWEMLEARSAELVTGMSQAAKGAKINTVVQRVGTMFTTFFTDQAVINWETAKSANTEKYAQYFRAMLEKGVYFAPSQFEAGFMSTAHREEDIIKTVAVAQEAFRSLF
jgi:glutamate-1-semialdehyde 2,1-aminomutase